MKIASFSAIRFSSTNSADGFFLEPSIETSKTLSTLTLSYNSFYVFSQVQESFFQ